MISEVFYKCGYIERWGTGTLKIIELCRDAGLSKPKYEQYSGGVSITFPYTLDVVLKENHYKISARVLPLRQQNILNVLSQSKKPMAITEIIENLETPAAKRTVQEDLQHLKDLKYVGSTGKGKATVWYFVEK